MLKDSRANPLAVSAPFRLGGWSEGPDLCDPFVEQEINKFLESPGGWMILNLHGLDNEGWGPISTHYLDKLLNRLSKVASLDVLPTGEVLKKFARD